MASRFALTGWKASAIAPRSSVGPVNAVAQSPLTAAALQTATGQKLNDPKLGSRGYSSVRPGKADVYLAESVYQRPNIPPYLAQAVSDLNTEQALKRSLAAEWQDKIFAAATSNDPNAFLFQEALRASSVNPGATVNFGSAVQSPLIGQSYQTAAQAYNTQAQAQAGAIAAPQKYQQQIAALQREQQLLGANSFGGYQNSRQQQINNQLFSLQDLLAGATQVAAGNNKKLSGWTPPPLY